MHTSSDVCYTEKLLNFFVEKPTALLCCCSAAALLLLERTREDTLHIVEVR